MTNKSELIMSKFYPELIFYIILAGLVIDFFVNVVLTGAVVKFLDEKSD
jgi:hypothetical protein